MTAWHAYSYENARSHILDGDCIAVRKKTGFLPTLTRYFTDSEYTHTGIAVWLDGGLWVAELNGGGNHVIPLSQIEGVDFDVFEPPPNTRPRIREAVLEASRVKTPYAFLLLPVIGLLNWVKAKVYLPWRRLLVCTGYCVMVYEKAGWQAPSRALSPKQLVELLEFKLAVRWARSPCTGAAELTSAE